MTANKRFKARVRARARRTGESYSSARHRLLVPSVQEAQLSYPTPTAPSLNEGVTEYIAAYASRNTGS